MAQDKDKLLFDAFNLPPEEAIKFFESKGFKISFNWYEMKREAHTKAFTVAGVIQMDVLKDIRQAVLDAQNKGTGFAQFKADVIPTLISKGWFEKKVVQYQGKEKTVDLSAPWRLKLIYNINMRTSMMAGRYKAMTDAALLRPYWRYRTVGDAKVRDEHARLNGKIFHYKDRFWDKYYPPNGWNCRCSVDSVSKSEFNRKNMKLDYGDNPENNIITDDGWDYNPAKKDFKPDYNSYPPKMATKLKETLDYPDLIKTEKERKTLEKSLDKNTKKAREDFADATGRQTQTTIEVVEFGEKHKEALMMADGDKILINSRFGKEVRNLNQAFEELMARKQPSKEGEFGIQAFAHEKIHIKAQASEKNYSLKRPSGILHELGVYQLGIEQYPEIMNLYGVKARYQNEMIALLPVEKTLTRLISELKEKAGVKPEEFSKAFESTLALSLEDGYDAIQSLIVEKGKMSATEFDKWFELIIKEFKKEAGIDQ